MLFNTAGKSMSSSLIEVMKNPESFGERPVNGSCVAVPAVFDLAFIMRLGLKELYPTDAEVTGLNNGAEAAVLGLNLIESLLYIKDMEKKVGGEKRGNNFHSLK